MYWSWGIRVTDYHQAPNPRRVAPTVLSGEEAATVGGTLPSHDLPEQRRRQVRPHPGLFIEKPTHQWTPKVFGGLSVVIGDDVHKRGKVKTVLVTQVLKKSWKHTPGEDFNFPSSYST